MAFDLRYSSLSVNKLIPALGLNFHIMFEGQPAVDSENDSSLFLHSKTKLSQGW